MKVDAPASAYVCKWQNTFKYEDMCYVTVGTFARHGLGLTKQ